MNKEEAKKIILQVLKQYQFGDNLKDGSYITGIKKYEFGNVADDIIKNISLGSIPCFDDIKEDFETVCDNMAYMTNVPNEGAFIDFAKLCLKAYLKNNTKFG